MEGCGRKDILRCIQQPTVDVDDDAAGGEDETNKEERTAAAVWQAMGEVAAASQATVSQSGVMLRFEAIRTGSDESVHRPLEPYQNRSDIARQGRHWQQLMMFFVRTKRDHEWRSPAYKFNSRQNQAF